MYDVLYKNILWSLFTQRLLVMPPNISHSHCPAQTELLDLSPAGDDTVYGWEHPDPRPTGHQPAHVTGSLTGWYCQVTMCVCLVLERLCCDWLLLCHVRQRWLTYTSHSHVSLGRSLHGWTGSCLRCSWGKMQSHNTFDSSQTCRWVQNL